MRSLLRMWLRWLDHRAGEATRASVASEPDEPDRYEPTPRDWAEYAEWSRADDERFAELALERDSECDSAEGDAWYRWMVEQSFTPGNGGAR
jgi:hypothetical protein